MTVRSVLADPSTSGVWALAADRSSVKFTARTLWGLVKVNGSYGDITGTGRIETNGAVSGRLTIAAASVKTGIAKRDEHLRSPDFFDTEQFPEIIVEVGGAEPTGDHSAALAATLTARGVTRPLPLTAIVTLLGNDTLHIVGRAEIDRNDWGVSGNTAGMIPATTALVADTFFVKA